MFWTISEAKIIKENPSLNSIELNKLLPNRSVIAIEQFKRKYMGSAGVLLKKGWNSESKDLAYLIGSWCSDGTCSAYSVSWSQKRQDRNFLIKVKGLVEKLFDLKVTDDFDKDKLYERIIVSSKQFVDNVFSLDGKGICKPEWSYLLLDKYSWIFSKDIYFWSFMSGLFDGDGCLTYIFKPSAKKGYYKKICIGIKPINSRRLIVDELVKRGYSVYEHDEGFEISSQNMINDFLSKLDLALKRKLNREGFGIEFITRSEANNFLLNVHYLKDSLKPATVSYGGFRDGKLVGVAGFGSVTSFIEMNRMLGKSYVSKVRELSRFATLDSEGKNFESSLLAKSLKKLYEDKNVWLVLSYADPKQGHTGGIYKALNAYYLGLTKSKKHLFVFIIAKGKDRTRAKELFLSNNRGRLTKW